MKLLKFTHITYSSRTGVLDCVGDWISKQFTNLDRRCISRCNVCQVFHCIRQICKSFLHTQLKDTCKIWFNNYQYHAIKKWPTHPKLTHTLLLCIKPWHGSKSCLKIFQKSEKCPPLLTMTFAVLAGKTVLLWTAFAQASNGIWTINPWKLP